MTAAPHTERKAANRLLEHCSLVSALGETRPRARERLDAALGSELARWLVGALAGDHRLPARAFVD